MCLSWKISHCQYLEDPWCLSVISPFKDSIVIFHTEWNICNNTVKPWNTWIIALSVRIFPFWSSSTSCSHIMCRDHYLALHALAFLCFSSADWHHWLFLRFFVGHRKSEGSPKDFTHLCTLWAYFLKFNLRLSHWTVFNIMSQPRSTRHELYLSSGWKPPTPNIVFKGWIYWELFWSSCLAFHAVHVSIK